MLKLLGSIVDFLIAIVNLVVSIFKGLFLLFSQIPAYITFISSSITVLPAFIIPFILCSILISVMYFISNRSVN